VTFLRYSSHMVRYRCGLFPCGLLAWV